MSNKGFGEDPLSVHELQDYNRSEYQDQDVAKTKGGTSADLADMQRMGRTQELRVYLLLCSHIYLDLLADSAVSVTSSLSVS
jgi:hypothetical protein